MLGVIYLREWRRHAGLSGEELGARLDPPASAGTISSYETGKRNIGSERLSQLAEVLGTTPGKILDEPPHPEGSVGVVAIPGEVVDIWAVISDRAKKQAIAMLRVIAEGEEEESHTGQR